MTERVKVYQQTRRQPGVPLWAWLIALLLVLALLLWFLWHRTHGTATPAATATSAATASPATQPAQTPPTALPVLAAVRFDPNKTELSNDAKEELDRIAETMRQDRHVHLRLEGYTDATGSTVHNENLSAERAANVADYLQRKGVDTAQLTGEGFAAANPVGSNASPQGRADNRRVEFFRTQ